ncbi:MAG TPA: F0F1 ATP synthase subunit alpha, partial [Acidimicrobiales bacterium]|nr:F0F1 ATP synthase subunit alpha [Acidimicrobiales bacterium]
MTELTIDAADITAALRRHVEEYQPAVGAEQIGRIVEVGDGIARVSGLPGAAVNELLEFEDGTFGLALNLDEDTIGAVVLGEVDNLEEEQIVKATGHILSVPVGDAMLGRVVNALGAPIDGKGSVDTTETRRMEVQAPGIIDRQPVSEPMQTGIKAIDAMTAIGRGQRELIIGDRQTGKSAIAIDTIINQRSYWESGDPKLQMRCIYVAIGQHWMYQGKHALIIFDDLSKQAEAYRAVSLLLRRPPG